MSVEVKRQMDSRIRSKDRIPEVVAQIARYERQIREHQQAVLSAYTSAARVLRDNLGLPPFNRPKSVAAKVPILVCHENRPQGNDTWLWKRLQSCKEGQIDPDPFVVDGGGIGRQSLKGNRPPWCPNGDWDELDLTRVFAQILSI